MEQILCLQSNNQVQHANTNNTQQCFKGDRAALKKKKKKNTHSLPNVQPAAAVWCQPTGDWTMSAMLVHVNRAADIYLCRAACLSILVCFQPHSASHSLIYTHSHLGADHRAHQGFFLCQQKKKPPLVSLWSQICFPAKQIRKDIKKVVLKMLGGT